MKDLMFATVAMQERYNKRIEAAVEALYEIKKERMTPTNDVIREIFISHGFKIPPERTDMRPYVYEAARALLRHYGVWIREDSDSKRAVNINKALEGGSQTLPPYTKSNVTYEYYKRLTPVTTYMRPEETK